MAKQYEIDPNAAATYRQAAFIAEAILPHFRDHQEDNDLKSLIIAGITNFGNRKNMSNWIAAYKGGDSRMRNLLTSDLARNIDQDYLKTGKARAALDQYRAEKRQSPATPQQPQQPQGNIMAQLGDNPPVEVSSEFFEQALKPVGFRRVS